MTATQLEIKPEPKITYEQVELPKPIDWFHIYTKKDAINFCTKLKKMKWEHLVVSLYGGGGYGARLGKLISVEPVPCYLPGLEDPQYTDDEWYIDATIQIFEEEPINQVFTPHLGSWKIALYLEDGQSVYPDSWENRKRFYQPNTEGN